MYFHFYFFLMVNKTWIVLTFSTQSTIQPPTKQSSTCLHFPTTPSIKPYRISSHTTLSFPVICSRLQISIIFTHALADGGGDGNRVQISLAYHTKTHAHTTNICSTRTHLMSSVCVIRLVCLRARRPRWELCHINYGSDLFQTTTPMGLARDRFSLGSRKHAVASSNDCVICIVR